MDHGEQGDGAREVADGACRGARQSGGDGIRGIMHGVLVGGGGGSVPARHGVWGTAHSVGARREEVAG